MSKRRYTHVQALLPEIQAMVESGKTQREIAEYYRFKDKAVVKRLLEREGEKQSQDIPKQRGHKPAKALAEYKYESKRLRMEAENFFSILKTECIYRHKPASFKEANEMIDRYIYFYNHEHIQLKPGVAPFTLRHSA